MIGLIGTEQLESMRTQHQALFSLQRRYLQRIGLIAAAILLWYVYFFVTFGISWQQLTVGMTQLSH